MADEETEDQGKEAKVPGLCIGQLLLRNKWPQSQWRRIASVWHCSRARRSARGPWPRSCVWGKRLAEQGLLWAGPSQEFGGELTSRWSTLAQVGWPSVPHVSPGKHAEALEACPAWTGAGPAPGLPRPAARPKARASPDARNPPPMEGALKAHCGQGPSRGGHAP